MRATLLALFCIAAPVTAADGDYYPLKIGNKWTFKIGEQEERFIWTAVKTEKVGEQECVVLEAKLKDQAVGSEHIAVLKDGIFRFKLGAATIDPPICFFKSDAKGKTWKEDFKVGGMATSASYTASVEDVEVPAGKFKDAIVIKTEATEKDVAFKATIWYVKDIGMVKQSFEQGNIKYGLALEKFEPAKDVNVEKK